MVVTQSADNVIAPLREARREIWEIDPVGGQWENGAAHPPVQRRQFEPLTLANSRQGPLNWVGPIGAGGRLNTGGAEGGFGTSTSATSRSDPELGIVR